MTATKYTKSIASDFTGLIEDGPCLDTLTEEIRNSTIIIALDHITVDGDVCDIWFKDALSSGDQTTLSNVVAAHTGVRPIVDEKRMDDGKLIVLPDIFNLGTYMNVSGVADDVANGARFSGSDLKITCSAQGEATALEFQLMECVGMVGARGVYANATFDDWIGLEILAPAQPSGVITENVGAGDYEKIVVVPGYLNKFKPKTNGDWDLDITSKLNANVSFTKAVVVPSATKTGYFDYNKISNILVVNSAGLGGYDIYDASVPLGKLGVKIWIIGDDQICMNIPAVRPRDILPHWKFKLRAYDAVYDENKPLKAALNIIVGRENLT